MSGDKKDEKSKTMERLLKENAKRQPYVAGCKDSKVLRSDVLNNLLWEMEFLVNYSSDGDQVVYAGSNYYCAHLVVLASLFPKLKFILYKPRYNVQGENITIKYSFLKKFQENNVLFIADDYGSSSREDMTYHKILSARTKMEKWHMELQPKKSLLRFVLPWKFESTLYKPKVTGLKGDIYLPIWGRRNTTLCKIVPSEGSIDYDSLQYEEQMAYFNHHTRVETFDDSVTKSLGLDIQYDSNAYVSILKKYLAKFNYHTEDIKTLHEYIFEHATHPSP